MSRMSRALVALAGHLHSVPNTHARQRMFLMIPAPGDLIPSFCKHPTSFSLTHTNKNSRIVKLK